MFGELVVVESGIFDETREGERGGTGFSGKMMTSFFLDMLNLR